MKSIDLLKKLHENVKAFKNSDDFKNHLRTLSKFHTYSWRNRFSIMLHCPSATLVKGFVQWKELGRFVKTNQRGIPIFIRKYKRVANTGIEDEDLYIFYDIGYVFDISQTDGKELPLITIETKTVEGEEYLEKLIREIRIDGIEVIEKKIESGAYGISKIGTIAITENLSPSMKFSTLLHEWAHEKMHKMEERIKWAKDQKEFEAESVSFLVCSSLSVPTHSEKYLSHYPDYDLEKSMSRVVTIADGFLVRLQK